MKDGDKARMNDIDCASIIQFVCEYSFNDNPNAVDVSKLPDILVPLTDYRESNEPKIILFIVILYSFNKTQTWTKRLCSRA